MNNSNNVKVCIIIVSYNRLTLLAKLISSIGKQTHLPSLVYIYDNNSSFSFDELLKLKNSFESIFTIEIFRSKTNDGGSGGFSNALKNNINKNFDYFWLMDDDVVPKDTCLEELIKVTPQESIVMPIKYWGNKCVDLNTLEAKFSSPFRIDYKGKLIKEMDISSIPHPCYVKTISFEGLFISKTVIYKIGFPMNNFFICHDDLEYSLRILKFQYKIRLLPQAILSREYDTNRSNTILSWKAYYVMRNYLFVNKIYGHEQLWLLRPFIVFISFLLMGIFQGKVKPIRGLIKGFFKGFSFIGTFEYPSITKENHLN